jgi:hypothetical protein
MNNDSDHVCLITTLRSPVKLMNAKRRLDRDPFVDADGQRQHLCRRGGTEETYVVPQMSGTLLHIRLTSVLRSGHGREEKFNKTTTPRTPTLIILACAKVLRCPMQRGLRDW